ncbi:branched-chain amino acid ABC transporter substrate-binding protein [Sodalis sp. C49]|uniref:branched-chain amino acid ABC transporter substrate-binding protein n=1 Tax=unclassified Sodalis (in: enterobacteria) TaxID=2636512 RepID=UPI003965B4AB
MKFNKGNALLAGCMAMAMSHSVWAQDIKVAVVGAMSGPVAQYGDMEFTGARQAIADINAKGGVKGNKLVGVEYDDACDPKQAVAVANKVINDGIKYVIGHLCSSSTQPASDIYEDEGVIMITPAATNADLTTRGYKMIMRTTGLDSDQGPTAAKYILDAVKPKRIAVVHDKQQYGEGLARSVQDSLKKNGGNVVLFEGITAGDKDFSTLVARLKKENVDFVYFGGYYPEMGQILRQAKQAGLTTKFMGPEGVGNSSLSNIAGAASEGMLVTLPKRYDQVPSNQPIVAALKAKKLDPTGPFVWTTYAAVQSLAAGMESAGMEPADIVKDLKARTVETVMGPLSWDEKGDLKGFEFGVFTWHADGTSTPIK